MSLAPTGFLAWSKYQLIFSSGTREPTSVFEKRLHENVPTILGLERVRTVIRTTKI
jgi:hypothetical protein